MMKQEELDDFGRRQDAIFVNAYSTDTKMVITPIVPYLVPIGLNHSQKRDLKIALLKCIANHDLSFADSPREFRYETGIAFPCETSYKTSKDAKIAWISEQKNKNRIRLDRLDRLMEDVLSGDK